MPITIFPNENVTAVVGVPVCFEAVGTAIIPQQDERCIDLPASGTNWVFDSALCKWTKNNGSTTGDMDAGTFVAETVHPLQPFYISALNATFTTPASPNRFFGSFVGAFKNGNAGFYGWYVWKNCGAQSTSNCNGTTTSNPDQNWKAFVVVDGVIVNPLPQGVNMSEQFRLRSNGVNLYWDYQSAGVWRLGVYSVQLPQADFWQYHLNSGWRGNEWHYLRTFKGTFQGQVPLTWTAPLGGTITGTGNNRCFESAISGTFQVCVDSDFDDPVCVDVEVDDIYLEPVDLTCGQCVFTGDVVHFDSNGGFAGTLTAESAITSQPSGVVIDALTWQAPGSPDTVDFTYTLEGNEAFCTLLVVDRINILNIEGNTLTGLIPGEEFQIRTNYDVEDLGEPIPEVETFGLVWENIDCPNIVNPYGLVKIPARANDDCFGALDCTIRAKFVGGDGAPCANLSDGSIYVDIRVIVDPVYPTPVFGGPVPVKWKPETPDFRVIINNFDGGCDETYLRNRVPIHRWTIQYSGLPYAIDNPCVPESCCDDFKGYIDGYDPNYHVAKRLDDFWMRVGGESGYFTLFDYRTGEAWRRVRFENRMEREHINWRTVHNRGIELIWAPCCATSPQGGVCPHNTAIKDTLNPSSPASLAANATSWDEIVVTWQASIDNVGIDYYELEVDGVSRNVGNVLTFVHSQLQPNSTHNYRIRAFDYFGNFSEWSSIVSDTTDDHDIISPSTPTGLNISQQTQTLWLIAWNAATDNVAVTGYKLMIDGYVFNVGNVLNYGHTVVGDGARHVYRVRSYDAVGNQSQWSAPVSEGFNYIFEDGEAVQEGSDLLHE